MVKVMATGTFDLLHMGHIFYLKESKKLGDTLVVVVATDFTVKKLKHDPITPQETRLSLIKELRIVDEAYLGHDDDMYTIVEEIKPDVIALGFDQIHDEKTIQSELRKRKLHAKVVRLSKYEGGGDLEGTRRIIQKVIAAHEFQKKMQRIEGET
ncbi:MAG TPA: adenylyltransferase/cytidyltransferase family protein [Candidatus Thermoplasmatota archaeon]|nr:adenylyltransferase/cytidyltransferase family protein [Candidatus Thermoplasmatota archaeon]